MYLCTHLRNFRFHVKGRQKNFSKERYGRVIVRCAVTGTTIFVRLSRKILLIFGSWFLLTGWSRVASILTLLRLISYIWREKDARADKRLEFLFNGSRHSLSLSLSALPWNLRGTPLIRGAGIYAADAWSRAEKDLRPGQSCQVPGKVSQSPRRTAIRRRRVRSSFLVSALIGRDQAGAICGFN